jgi:hypothetical protein
MSGRAGSDWYIPASRGDLSGDFPRPVDITWPIDPDAVRKAMRTTAHYATKHVPDNRMLTEDEAGELRLLLEALGFVPYISNPLNARHK